MNDVQTFLEKYFIAQPHTIKEALTELTSNGLTIEDADTEIRKFFKNHKQAGFDEHPPITLQHSE